VTTSTVNDILRGTSLHVRRQITDRLDAIEAQILAGDSSNAFDLALRAYNLAMFGQTPDSQDWILPSQIFGP